ncbi:MAG TPA: hypothetical protein VLS93_03375 [Anaeromyxobacteraceae bacterium]|nr:hypothetical protein [Anaeromyxobacteraceae bacterium]
MNEVRLSLLLAATATLLACSQPAVFPTAPSQLSVPNGLLEQGLVESGLTSTDFSTWFNQDPERSSAAMGDLVRCAVPGGSTRTWQNPSTGVRYTWYGEMGVTPKWSSGSPCTPLEKKLITTCIASLRNNRVLPPPRPAPPRDRAPSPGRDADRASQGLFSATEM